MAENRIAAAALAGGASSRMGRPKALMPFLGEPLVARVLGRLRLQVRVVYLNAEGGEYAGFGVKLTPDSPRWRGRGPLAGVAAALAEAAADGFAFLATAPCDAPFVPLDLVARLSASGGAAAAVSASGLEPTFALWPVEALALVEEELALGRASPRAVLERLGAARTPFPEGAFANLNTPDEFAAAEAAARMLEAGEPASGRT
jgi:molybdopterin-guanine dinucleotide biosynthesis protein A